MAGPCGASRRQHVLRTNISLQHWGFRTPAGQEQWQYLHPTTCIQRHASNDVHPTTCIQHCSARGLVLRVDGVTSSCARAYYSICMALGGSAGQEQWQDMHPPTCIQHSALRVACAASSRRPVHGHVTELGGSDTSRTRTIARHASNDVHPMTCIQHIALRVALAIVRRVVVITRTGIFYSIGCFCRHQQAKNNAHSTTRIQHTALRVALYGEKSFGKRTM
jgi:hypothetical protein